MEMTRQNEVLRMIVGALSAERGRLGGRRAVLFGSRATGTAGERSDFDIGIDGDSPLPLRDFYAIEERIDNLDTLYRIDLVDLCRADPRFREEALSRVEVLIG